MEQIRRIRYGRFFLLFFYAAFLFWTGILLWLGCRQGQVLGKLQSAVIESLAKQGAEQADLVRYLEADTSSALFSKWTLAQTNSLSYLAEKEGMPEADADTQLVDLISLFVGNSARQGLLAQETEEEKKEDEVSDKTDTQDVVLFRNGSMDITANNAAAKESGEDICDSKEALAENKGIIARLKKSLSRSYLLRKFYITDSSTSIDNSVFQPEELLSMDLTLEKSKEPQILIFHTHGASEAFWDSREGVQADSIVGVGTKLAKILSEEYGYQVLHDKTEYDKIDGKIDRNKAYNNAYEGLQKILEQYPSIEVIIDLHRDGVGNKVNRTTVINGKKTAQVMFFNGLSRNTSGDIEYLQNDNLQGNLAFSLQLKIASMERFESFARPVYLKSYRYNMHLKKRFTLIELGNENNTVRQAKNAAEPLAMVIDAVLQGS